MKLYIALVETEDTARDLFGSRAHTEQSTLVDAIEAHAAQTYTPETGGISTSVRFHWFTEDSEPTERDDPDATQYADQDDWSVVYTIEAIATEEGDL